MTKPLLQVRNFNCYVGDQHAPIHIANDICFSLNAGEVMAIVGESGCGKSLTFSRMFGVGEYTEVSGDIHLGGTAIHNLSAQKLSRFRGKHIGFLFQDPALAFNPTMTLGKQLCEGPLSHGLMTKKEAVAKAIGLLAECDLEQPEQLLSLYPHQLSGGMLQRVMLAMALMCDPLLLIADEPTTALDAISAQKVLALISRFSQKRNMACLLITHDFDVVNQVASHVGVMYGGELIESGLLNDVMYAARHPYTKALQQCRPVRGNINKSEKLTVIDGQPPIFTAMPSGCAFHPRCPNAMEICAQQAPPLYLGNK